MDWSKSAGMEAFFAPHELAARLDPDWLADERRLVSTLLDEARPPANQREAIARDARLLAEEMRQQGRQQPGLESLLSEYAISSEEGVILMCLAEALLRIPDDATALCFLEDQVRSGDWSAHQGHSPAFWINASTWGLLVCGRFLQLESQDPPRLLQNMLLRLGEPVMLRACRQAVEMIGARFVTGRDIDHALSSTIEARAAGFCHSFDMLGEAAMTAAAAEHYLAAYAGAIEALGRQPADRRRPSLSVKLSALHPRYRYAQRADCMPLLQDRLTTLCRLARDANIGLTIDAEEAVRLQLSLEIFEAVFRDSGPGDWQDFGLAVQAYQKRAPAVIDWLDELAGRHRRRIPVRLVKGAYWDSEIKQAQVDGLPGYPVYLNKASTDIAWLACARRMLFRSKRLYPQFASHNAHSIASVLSMAGDGVDAERFELQRLHGMGEGLHACIRDRYPELSLRVYAPVGPYRELLPYLVRRLLENGANSSFLHRLADPAQALEPLLQEPADSPEAGRRPAGLPAPQDLCLPRRRLAAGRNLDSASELQVMLTALQAELRQPWQSQGDDNAAPAASTLAVHSPADRGHRLGDATLVDDGPCRRALQEARAAQPAWDARGAGERATLLEQIGELYWEHRDALAARIVFEGGRTLACAVGEIREAIDFCYYYAAEARRLMARPCRLPGPTGEDNRYRLRGRGVFACISPWNFPLAIFSGQVLAALAAGNAVLAKPASATMLTAAYAGRLMHEAGVPTTVLRVLPTSARCFEDNVLADPALAGVAFTGSNAVAGRIRQVLAADGRPAIPLIAETGGVNCMIVDSSALAEQVVADAMLSAFDSAGQRCSALRLLCLQDDVADSIMTMLAGAIRTLKVGHPAHPATDVGPVISADAREELLAHRRWLQQHGKLLAEAPVNESCCSGHYVAPQAWQIDRVDCLQGEVFGPFLHIVRWRAGELDALVDAINQLGYGLTLGIQSRIRTRWWRIADRARVGNIYVNRNIIGAHVGMQPFGGEGLSGSGPKAGGPGYLQRFAVEQSISINSAAIGGNPSLLGNG